MRKHRSKCHVTNALDALYASVELVVDDDTALGVKFDTDLVEAETLRIGDTANSYEDDVGFQLVLY